MAVTTNGTFLKPMKPNRVHISYDELHPTWKNEDLIHKAIKYYKKHGSKVGINHIVTNLENIEYIYNTFENIDNLLLIREKPESKLMIGKESLSTKISGLKDALKDRTASKGF